MTKKKKKKRYATNIWSLEDSKTSHQGDVLHSCWVKLFSKPSLLATASGMITGLTQDHCSCKRNKLLRYNLVEIRV